ncbi:hypothetical protein CC86DRAFT_381106 [Ophiobolus disseminans]|uniref:Uncharacterized protein n=1 Tax=Ophiobolus disseminans TaxID=1469910 RepID=A0A6A7A5W1_9PLEO|nr:hypothetical protein CC86DRAFT_381106 [Ophiobolus disseminans]
MTHKPEANLEGVLSTMSFQTPNANSYQPRPLPAEVLHQICSNLGTSDVAAFRPSCGGALFFLPPRSIAKVKEIAHSKKWAGQVKILVFEDVRGREWPYIPEDKDMSAAARDILLDEGMDIWGELNKMQQSYRNNNLGALFAQLLPRFCNLKGIHLHQGFKDPRPVGPDAQTPFATVIQARKQSLQKWTKVLWDDRASRRVWLAGQDDLTSNGASTQLNSHIKSYWDLAKRALNAVSVQSAGKGLPPVLTKLKTLTIQGATDSGLIKLNAKDKVELGKGPMHLILHYEPRRWPGYALGFDSDVEHLSKLRYGSGNLAKLTLTGGQKWDSWWLDLWPLGSSLLSVSASGYWVVVGHKGDGGMKFVRIARSETDPANTSSSDEELSTWNQGEWLHPDVVETFMMSGGRTNETFGFMKPMAI